MITKIELENWKSHEKTILNFGKGINLFLGNIGSGKSSVIDAICFALFNTFPDLNSKNLKLEDVIMNKPQIKNYAKIILNLNLEKNYTIKKVIEKNFGTKAELIEENKIIETSVTNVNEFIKNKLKIDYKTFYFVIYSQQNYLNFILDLPKGERKLHFDKILGIEKIETARKASVSLKNLIFKDIEFLRKSLKDKDLNKMISEINELKNEIKLIESEINEVEKSINEVSEVIKDISMKISELENIEDEINNLKVKISELESKKVEKEKRIKELSYFAENKEKIKEELEKIKIILENVEKEIEELKNKVNEEEKIVLKINSEKVKLTEMKKYLENEIEELKIDLENYDKLKSENFEKIESLEKEILEIKSFLKHLELHLIETLNQVEILKKAEANCPVCNSVLDNKKREELKKEKEEKIEKIKEEQRKNYEKLKQKEEELEILKRKKREFEILKQKYENYLKIKEELENLNKKISELEKVEIPNVEKTKKELEEKRNYFVNLKVKEKEMEESFKKVVEYEKLKTEINEIEKELEKLKEKFENLNSKFDKKLLIELRNRKEEFLKIEAENKLKLESLKKIKIEKELRLKEKEKIYNEIKANFEQLEKLEKYYKDLEILEKALKEVQEIVRNELLQNINYYLSKIWKMFYPYKDYKDLRLIATEDDYILQFLTSQEKWVEVEKVGSGGEKTIASICLRFALAKTVAPKVNFIIFDEPTHNLDEKSIEHFANFLNNYATEIYDQIFLVTHDEKFERLLNANIYKFYRDKELDLPTKVEEYII